MTTNERRQPPRHQNISPEALGLPRGLIEDFSAVEESLQHLNGLGVNLLSPVTRIDHIPPGFQLAFRAILFPTDNMEKQGRHLTNGTWYETDGGGFALHKASLRQLAAVAGVSIESEMLPSETNRWIFKATARVRTLDGVWRTVSATKDVDLRDDGPIVPTWHEEAARKRKGSNADWRVLKAREHGGRMAESKAVNAALRSALGLRAAYPKHLAERPFVFPMLVFMPTTPEAKQLQAAVEYGVVHEVYGPATVTPAGPVVDITPELAPESHQLPDHGPGATPDYAAEAAKLSQRPKIARAPSREDLAAFSQAKGWGTPQDEGGWSKLSAHAQGKGREDFEAFMGAGSGPGFDPDW